jgi:hypothetical protein
MEGSAMTEYASLSGKIHSLVIDKSLSISGAAADAKATGDKIDRLADLVGDGVDYAETMTMTADISTDWATDEANGGYYKTVPVSGILESDNPVVDVVLGKDIVANDLYQEAWALVDRIVTANNSITLYANWEIPATAFTIQLKVVR